MRQMPRALASLKRASDLAPNRLDFVMLFARALSMAHLRNEALAVAERACSLAWQNAQALDALGVIYTQAGKHGKAADIFRRVVELAPDQAHYRYNFSASLVTSGDIEQAERELEKCLALDPAYWRAHLAMAQVRKQTPEHNHIAQLEALLTSAGDNEAARINLHLALAKEHEDLGHFPQALDHLVSGKAAAVTRRRHAFNEDEALFEALEQTFPTPIDTTPGCDSSEPIFVIGMPRSGTTLVERILSSHPDVYSAGELMHFGISLKRATGSRTKSLIDVDTVRRAVNLDWRRLGENYLASTRPATGQTAHFIDKLPHNFLYAGFIAQALPKAKIICLRRHPMDTCLSNFRQLFGADAPFFGYSFNLEHTARYYVLFDRLMTHWQQAIPGRILEIAYEDIVADQENSTRKLLDYCELPWNDACLAFERNRSPVTTASAVQVRSRIYTTAMGRWKEYGSALDGISEILRSSGIHF